jgi:hypothetical protein
MPYEKVAAIVEYTSMLMSELDRSEESQDG